MLFFSLTFAWRAQMIFVTYEGLFYVNFYSFSRSLSYAKYLPSGISLELLRGGGHIGEGNVHVEFDGV